MYFAHEGVDHSTGATHENSSAASAFIAITLVAIVILAGTLVLVKRYVSNPTKAKEKE